MAIKFLSGVNIDSNTLFVDDANNRVGIGTGSPTAKLQLYGSGLVEANVTSTNDQALLYLQGTFGQVANNAGDFYITNSAPSSSLILRTADTERMRITSTGNVGIGTTSPGAPLHVSGSNASLLTSIVENTSNATGAYAGYRIQSDYGHTYLPGLLLNSSTNTGYAGVDQLMLYQYHSKPISLVTNNIVRLMVSGAGDVGIGTTAPGAKLTVYTGGASAISGTNDGIRLQVSSYNNSARNTIAWHQDGSDLNLGRFGLEWNSGTSQMNFVWRDVYNSGAGVSELMRLQGNGNLGIGTTIPASILQLGAGPSIPTNAAYNSFQAGSFGVLFRDNYDSYITFNTTYSTSGWLNKYNGLKSGVIQITDGRFSIDLGTGTVGGAASDLTERFVILNNGNVGIGTTTPGYKLDVSGDINFSNTLKFGGVNVIHNGSTDVYGNIRVLYSASTLADGMYINYNSAGGGGAHLRFFANSTNERMRIDANSGYVGINTTSPQALLHVQGSNLMTTFRNSDTGVDQYSQIEFVAGSRTAYIWLGNQNTTSWAGAGGLNIYTANGNMDFWTSNAQRVRIDTSGNFGIGTMAPAAKLDVVGVIRYGDNSSSIGALSYGTGVVTLEASSANTHVSIIPSGTGNVGIATLAPSQKLHVTGNVRVTGAYYDSSNSAGSSGQVLSSTGSGTDWVSLSEITGVDGTGTANYIAKWSDTDTITNSQIRDDGTTVGVGQAPAAAKMSVNGALNVGGRYLYNNFQSSLDTTGVAVAGLSASTNGDSAFFTFEAGASNGQYQRIVWSCYNAAGDWNVVKVIDEGTNAFDVVASASSGATITFTWKSRSGTLYYTPRLIITGVGSINTSYL